MNATVRLALAQETRIGGPVRWPLFAVLRAASKGTAERVLIAVWVGVVAASVALGLLIVVQGWSGVPVQLGPFAFSVTAYPTPVLGVLLVLFLGPLWGIIPAFLGSFALATLSGMPIWLAVAFALADPLMLLVLWGAMSLVNASPELESWRDLAVFVGFSAIAAVVDSSGAAVWSMARGLDFLQAQAVWEGWVVGAFAQNLLLVAPIAKLFGHRVRSWLDRHLTVQVGGQLGAGLGQALLVAVLASLLLTGTMVAVGFFRDVGTEGIPLSSARREFALFLIVFDVASLVGVAALSAAINRKGRAEALLTLVDPLTKCLNRRAFGRLVPHEIHRSRRLGDRLAAVLIDVDEFKEINDSHGHATGDHVLTELAVRVREVIRDTDYFFRWGGDEFLLLLPGTGVEDALGLAHRLHREVTLAPVPAAGALGEVQLSISIGVSA
ncbi:MAG: GGDEF domain-containing protein, partial [Acidobacteria bacterium]|nr:GGDEF domain-containing protein [Acidobacteriota bacterium]